MKLQNAVDGIISVSSCTTEDECYYAGQEQRTYARIGIAALNDHLDFMASHPAARCFRDAYAADRNLAKSWVKFLSSGSGSSSGEMRYFMQVLRIWRGETYDFLSKLDGYFRDCK